MRFSLIVVGLILLTAAARGRVGELATALKSDVPGFIPWIAAVVVLWYTAQVPGLENFGWTFLVLTFVVLALVNQGAFPNFINTLKEAGK